jgi:hypothetical protein
VTFTKTGVNKGMKNGRGCYTLAHFDYVVPTKAAKEVGPCLLSSGEPSRALGIEFLHGPGLVLGHVDTGSRQRGEVSKGYPRPTSPLAFP